MNLLFWGLTVSVVGKVLLAIGVLWAHSEIAHEKRIDSEVIDGFKVERWITILGLALIVFGYAMEVVFYGFTPIMDCGLGQDCAAALMQAGW